MIDRGGTSSLLLAGSWWLLGCNDPMGDPSTTTTTSTSATTGAPSDTTSCCDPGSTTDTSGADDTSSPSTDGSGGSTTGAPTGCGDPPVWCPTPGTAWHWQLTGTLDVPPDVAMVDIDLFDTDPMTIELLHDEGRVVICYFSAGSHEDWRPDADQFPPAAIGDPLDGWPGERWLDVRDEAVRTALAGRLDLATSKGCDGVEPDNVDGYTNPTGFPLTAEDQLDFNTWLAEQSHQRALSVGLKNDLDQVEALLPHFDWALNEECMAYDECDRLAPFIAADKAVFHVEYVDDPAQGPDLAAQICPDALARSFSTLVKGWDLDAWGIACE